MLLLFLVRIKSIFKIFKSYPIKMIFFFFFFYKKKKGKKRNIYKKFLKSCF